MSSGVVVRWVLAGALLLGAAACERKPVESPYFPLEVGRTWRYTLKPDPMGEDEEPVELTVASLGPEQVSGQRVTRQKIDLAGEAHFLFIGVDENGVFRFATQSPGEAAPWVDIERDYFLSNPLTVGNSWKGKGAPSFLGVPDVAVPIESTVESTTDTVKTPAGEFANCLKINVTGSMEITDDDEEEEEPAHNVAVTEDEEDFDLVSGKFSLREQTWYAPGVGVVKSVIEESFDSEFDEQRVRVITELQSFTR